MSENNTFKNEIILAPAITHKSTLLATDKCYTFYVKKDANKYQIAEAFNKLFDAEALKVRTVTVRSKKKRTRKGYILKSDRKKAYISSDKELKDIFPSV